MKGRCLNRLTTEPYTPRVGFEPTTLRLTAECSTAELSRNAIFKPKCLYLQNPMHPPTLHPCLEQTCRNLQPWSSLRPISSSPLRASLHFHSCPIYLVFYKGPYRLAAGTSHLGAGFTLRCLQRLSPPGLATLPWAWQPNRYTSGPSTPVLSY